jgi:hypothetical protein
MVLKVNFSDLSKNGSHYKIFNMAKYRPPLINNPHLKHLFILSIFSKTKEKQFQLLNSINIGRFIRDKYLEG